MARVLEGSAREARHVRDIRQPQGSTDGDRPEEWVVCERGGLLETTGLNFYNYGFFCAFESWELSEKSLKDCKKEWGVIFGK